ncbi:hypothetical protein [Aquimarina sp. 2201CG5-10]|uniref:hypothetical protein n=1 Tax=Aquimarina callyspongiae TaxID=3098150 RepID=UPI002AB4F53A|nr:hypothetical protein [Aquimarina sp. 2201CG5-10]MDY8134551.1 hypothetical protein [Aquimarina sp. 2201CG5-10]
MTSGLRNTHKIIWILLIIAVPILIILSVQSIKEPLFSDNDELFISETSNQRTILEDQNFLIHIKEQNTGNVLHIILKKPLKSASSLVYGITTDTQKEVYIGTLNNTGQYSFDIDKLIKKVKIYDEIKQNDILNIEL